MGRIILLFVILVSFPSFPSTFAYTRQEIITHTLNRWEGEHYAESIEKKKNEAKNVSPPRSPLAVGKSKIPEERENGLRGNFYISAGYNANHLHYKELSSGDTLDEDYGKLKGFYITAGYKGSNYLEPILGKPVMEGYFRRFDELITYDGAASNGIITYPFSFDEKQEIYRFGIKIGSYRDFLEKGEVFGYIDIGERIWYRGEDEVIRGVLTYGEKYWWTYLGIGGGASYEIVSKLTIGIDTEWMFSLGSSKMRANLYEGGTFNLGSVYGAEVKIPLKYQVGRNLSFDLTPYFTYWNIEKSDYVTISGSLYIEPDSKTHIEGLLVGLTYTL